MLHLPKKKKIELFLQKLDHHRSRIRGDTDGYALEYLNQICSLFKETSFVSLFSILLSFLCQNIQNAFLLHLGWYILSLIRL